MLLPYYKMKLSTLIECNYRRFSKSVSKEEERQIYIFVYQWNFDRLLHIFTLGFTKARLEEEKRFKKEIYKDFKIRFPLIKQPNDCIESAMTKIEIEVTEAIQSDTFQPALEID